MREGTRSRLLYVGMARGAVDERGVRGHPPHPRGQKDEPRLTLAEFKALVREQYFMLLIDEEAALAAIPAMLPPDAESGTRPSSSSRGR